MKRKHQMNVFLLFFSLFFVIMCVFMFADILLLFLFKACDCPVICHQTVSLQLFDLHLCVFCCLLIIIDSSKVLCGLFSPAKQENPKQIVHERKPLNEIICIERIYNCIENK